MSFNAQIRADIETLDVTINNYKRMANAPEAWGRIKKILVEEKLTSTNKPSDDMCPECYGTGAEDLDGNRPIKCSTCNGSGHTSHVGRTL